MLSSADGRCRASFLQGTTTDITGRRSDSPSILLEGSNGTSPVTGMVAKLRDRCTLLANLLLLVSSGALNTLRPPGVVLRMFEKLLGSAASALRHSQNRSPRLSGRPYWRVCTIFR